MISRYENNKNFKNKLPKLLIENNNSKKFDHLVSKEDRKVKDITLSIPYYNKFINDYKNSLKYPSSNFYSTDKLKHSIPFKIFTDINLNKKANFISTFNEFNLYKQTGIFRVNTNNNNDNFDKKNLLSRNNFDLKNYTFLSSKYYEYIRDEEILEYFIEGTFLCKPQKLKYIGINEKNIYPHKLNQNDFNFYQEYLDTINKNENLTDFKSKEYEMYNTVNKSKIKYVLDLKSVCFHFDEININNTENKNNDFVKLKNSHKIYLPFKYLPLIYLFTFAQFKSFLSEILSYDYQNNKFNFVLKEEFEKIIKKYSDYCMNTLYIMKEQKDEQTSKNIILYENEFLYNNEFFWLVYDNNNKETKTFKLKIIYPLIDFQVLNYNIIFHRYLSKWLLLELVKNNFLFWDRYLLFNLFLNKIIRKAISEILNKKRGFMAYQDKKQIVGQNIYNKKSKSNNFGFFITDMNSFINHYYFIVPYKASITKAFLDKSELCDTVSLQLNEARKIYKLSKYFGLIGIFNKYMFYNKHKKKFFFSMEFLDDINDDYFSFLKEQKHQFIITNNDTKNEFKHNGINYLLEINDCFLCEKTLDNSYCNEFKYYKIPDKLYDFILRGDFSEQDEIMMLNDQIKELINLKVIESNNKCIIKTKSTKSYKSKDKESPLLRKLSSDANNSRNKMPKVKVTAFKDEKKSEKDVFPKMKIKSSLKNVKIINNK